MFDHDADRRRESGLHVFKTLAEAMKPPATPEALSQMTERDKRALLHALAAELGMVVSRKEPRPLSEPLMASRLRALHVLARVPDIDALAIHAVGERYAKLSNGD